MFRRIHRNMEVHVEFDYDTDVRVRATLSFRLTVRHDTLKLTVSVQVKCRDLE